MNIKTNKKLHLKAKQKFSHEDLIKLIKKTKSTYLGIIKNLPTLSDILKARKFIPSSSLYGNRYGKNVSALFDVRKKGVMDFYVTDDSGILSNSVTNNESARERISKAKKSGKRIIYFFGGSTMMGMGARTPDFSIPALVEKILFEDYGEKTICINFGIGGSESKVDLNLLIFDALNIATPDSVVFYNGWNCCSYGSITNLLREQFIDDSKLLLFNGENLRQVEYNLILKDLYSLKYFFKRSIVLTIASIFSVLYNVFNNSFFHRIIFAIQNRIINLRPSETSQTLLKQIDFKKKNIIKTSKQVAKEYNFIQEYAHAICKSKGIEFYNVFQPLVFYGNKKLTKNERKWRDTAYSSFNSDLYYNFHKNLLLEINKGSNRNFFDCTLCFDDTKDEVYIDSGHLNRLGNVIVSEHISSFITKNDSK